jgi:axin 1
LNRSKRYQLQPPLPQKTPTVPPPIPAKNLLQQQQQQILQQPLSPQLTASQPPSETAATTTTTVVYSFCDEDVPYRIKIAGKSPVTLKQFKDFLPKKGQYR